MTWENFTIKFAKAIALAEGSPKEWNNPGDLTYADGFPVEGIANSEGVLKFKNSEDGWTALYHQCDLMLTGKSHVYQLSDTLAVVGLKYSGGTTSWAKNVAFYLKVPVTITLKELAAALSK